MRQQQNKNLKSRMVIAMVILIMVAVITTWMVNKKTPRLTPDKFYGTLLMSPRAISDFELVDHDGQPFTTGNLKNKWTFAFFGFTNCPEVCPTTLANLDKFYKLLQQRQAKELPQILLISVDPERDTPKKMKNYVTAFNSNFIGVTGQEKALEALTTELGIVYEKIARNQGEDPEDYTIEHTGTIMLFDPQGRVRAFFTSPQDMAKIADDYMLLLSAN